MRRLYLQIYLTLVAILVIVVVTMGLAGRFAFDDARFDDMITAAGELAANALPPPDAPRARQEEAIERLHDLLRVDLALYTSGGALIAEAGRPLPPLELEGPGRLRGFRGTWLVPMSDGRFLVTSIPRGPWRPRRWLLIVLAGIAVAVAVGAWPLTRRLTRRLERLKEGVDRFGAGDLAARVKIEGKDEIAALAQSFNTSAGRIEELMHAHKMLLANASHELRTPLTRINMALAMPAGIDAPQRERIKADITELDQLIGEILLASRLDAVPIPERTEDIDFLALAAEEAARDGIAVEGVPVNVHGERALLRRMIRNLIDNARRHGSDAAPDIRVSRHDGGRALLEVRDHGPGIPQDERERIFEPFYRLAGSAETGRGSGLGLALVRQIARHHGGDVTCGAAEGGGSVFAITLPASDAGVPRPA